MDPVVVDVLQRLHGLSLDRMVQGLLHHYGDVTWPFVLDLCSNYAVFLTIALGLYILMIAGQVSLGHAGLVGIAAYSSAILVVKFGLPFWLALPICGGVGALAGLVYCYLFGLRLSGFYLVIGTLAFGEMLISIWLNTDYVGAALGFSDIPLETRWPVLLTIVPLILFAVRRIEQSRFGIAFRAVRDNPVVAGSMGINVNRTKMLAWAIGGFITGIGGCLHAHRVTVLTPDEFGIYFSLTILMAPLIGGLRTFWGTVAGAAVVYFVPWLTTTDEPRDRLMLYGIVIVLLMIFRPEGLVTPRVARRREPAVAKVARGTARSD